MEDIEVNTKLNSGILKPDDINKPKGNNILFKPTFDQVEVKENIKIIQTKVNQTSVLNRSSMMTYGKMYYFL